MSWETSLKSSDKELLLETRNLSWFVNKKKILKEINFSHYRGERWVIIGDNDSGKTSFINLLSGLQKTTVGKIYCKFEKKEK